jgi:8-oxo-dGTP pyrophosphatase MutT (NUDIX family)
METPLYRPPNTFYRVSLKAVIRDTNGRILVVKENDSNWSLPGGGWDHGEMEHEALARELHEEVGFKGEFTSRIFATETFWLEHRQSWLMWLVYEIIIDSFDPSAFSIGEDADAIAWMYPKEFEAVMTDNGRWIYEHLT